MKSILEKSYEININNSSEIIQFYEDNKLYFDNYDKITDIEGIEKIILIKQKYCEAIVSKNHFADATTVLTHIFVLLDKLKGNSEEYESYYERALFFDGVILGRKKKYKESNEKFKQLILLDPKNENYQNWIETNKECIVGKKLNNIFYIALPILAFIMVSKEKFVGENYLIFEISLWIMMIGLIIYQQYVMKFIREKRKKRTNS